VIVPFPEGQRILEGIIWRSLRHFLNHPKPEYLVEDVDWLRRLISLGHELGGIALVRSQELYWQQISEWLSVLRQEDPPQAMMWLKPLLKLAKSLAIDPQALLTHDVALRQATESH
jgi:hypothetical protein